MPDPSPNRGVMIVLAYLWFLALIPLLLDKDDGEVQWHARNGIALTIAELAGLFVYLTIASLIGLATLGIGCVLLVFTVFVWVGVLAIHLIAILKAWKGERLMIPVVSEYASKW